jgi:hypothetical protein
MTISLGDFNAKVGREDISKPTIRNESLHEISNDNGVNCTLAAFLDQFRFILTQPVKFGTKSFVHIIISDISCLLSPDFLK